MSPGLQGPEVIRAHPDTAGQLATNGWAWSALATSPLVPELTTATTVAKNHSPHPQATMPQPVAPPSHPQPRESQSPWKHSPEQLEPGAGTQAITGKQMLPLRNFLHPSLKAGFLKHPGLEPQRDLAHFAVSEQGKARPEAKASEAIPGHHHQPREEEMLQSGGP